MIGDQASSAPRPSGDRSPSPVTTIRRMMAAVPADLPVRSMRVESGLTYRLLPYSAGVGARMQLSFGVLQVALELVDTLAEREHVVAGRIVDAFQRFDDPDNLAP